MDKMGNFKVYTTFIWVKLLLIQCCQCCVSYLKKADNFTYYSKSDAHYSHIILQKNVFPIILNYSGKKGYS